MKICDPHKVSIWRKLWLGPMVTTNCKICNQKVSVPYWAEAIAMLPLFCSLALFNKLEGSFGVASLVMGVVLSAIIQLMLPIRTKK